jgi:phosphopantothenoylcysteine decarboxylase / phosphopantothenate---cysteine ligase
MLTHPLVQKNLTILKNLQNIVIFPTQTGLLACGDFGEGKLLEVEHIFDLITSSPLRNNNNQKNILIATGATISPLDPVRFLTNPSSGITGFFLAKEALQRGYKVTVLAGKYSTKRLDNLIGHPNYSIERIVTTSDLLIKVKQHFNSADIYISPAAISDISFFPQNEKIKKTALKNSIPLQRADDILKYTLSIKRKEQKIIGFAAETNLSEETLKTKWLEKPVDLLVGTKVNNGVVEDPENPQVFPTLQGFEQLDANYVLFNGKSIEFEGHLSKSNLAKEILNRGLI